MSEMFPDLSAPLPHTVSPTTNTWNKVDQDIMQHTYNIHYDMITKLQSEVKELTAKVVENEKNIKLLQMTHVLTTLLLLLTILLTSLQLKMIQL